MNILFVCTGNTCRSPMAEALFNAAPQRPPQTTAFSAGLSALPEDTVSPGAVVALQHYNLDLSGRKAVRFSKELADQADLILTMTAFQEAMLLALFPEMSAKIYSFAAYLNQFAPLTSSGQEGSTELTPPYGEVEDPYGQPQLVYDRVAEQIAQMISRLQECLTKAEKQC